MRRTVVVSSRHRVSSSPVAGAAASRANASERLSMARMTALSVVVRSIASLKPMIADTRPSPDDGRSGYRSEDIETPAWASRKKLPAASHRRTASPGWQGAGGRNRNVFTLRYTDLCWLGVVHFSVPSCLNVVSDSSAISGLLRRVQRRGRRQSR